MFCSWLTANSLPVASCSGRGGQGGGEGWGLVGGRVPGQAGTAPRARRPHRPRTRAIDSGSGQPRTWTSASGKAWMRGRLRFPEAPEAPAAVARAATATRKSMGPGLMPACEGCWNRALARQILRYALQRQGAIRVSSSCVILRMQYYTGHGNAPDRPTAANQGLVRLRGSGLSRQVSDKSLAAHRMLSICGSGTGALKSTFPVQTQVCLSPAGEAGRAQERLSSMHYMH